MKNIRPFYILFQVLKVLLIKKNLRYNRQIFYSLLFYISFYISEYHLQNFIQHYQKKRIFVTNFPFLTDSLKHPQPSKRSKSAKCDKFFVDAVLDVAGVMQIGLLFYKVAGCFPVNLVKLKPLTGIFQGFLLQEYSNAVHNRFLQSTFIYQTILNKCFLFYISNICAPCCLR